MGTKQKPGAYDCYEKAAPDEPMFILLARDKGAPKLVRDWAYVRGLGGESPEKVAEAVQCAADMETWYRANKGTMSCKDVMYQLGRSEALEEAAKVCTQRIMSLHPTDDELSHERGLEAMLLEKRIRALISQ
jgi:hypothetical protein